MPCQACFRCISQAHQQHTSVRLCETCISAQCMSCSKHASRREGSAVQGPKLMQDLVDAFDQYDGYVNSASKKLIASVHAGKRFPEAAAEDDQAHCLIKVPIVLARYIGAWLGCTGAMSAACSCNPVVCRRASSAGMLDAVARALHTLARVPAKPCPALRCRRL